MAAQEFTSLLLDLMVVLFYLSETDPGSSKEKNEELVNLCFLI